MYNGTISYFFRITEWIAKLAILNLLWIGFSLLGLVVFGIGPATAAVFAVEREWIMGKTDAPTIKTFWSTYKKEFFKANLLGIIFMFIGFVLYEDLQFTLLLKGVTHEAFLIMTSIIFFVYALTLTYLFPVYAHLELGKLGAYVKHAFLLGISQLLSTLFIILGLFIAFLVFKYIPALIPFYFFSSISMHISLSVHSVFKKIERKKKELQL